MPISFHSDEVREEIRIRTKRRRESLRDAASAEALRLPRNDLLPRLQITHLLLGELSLPKRKVRKLNRAQVERVKTSIATFGFTFPILVRRTGEIVDGVARCEAARQLGLAELPCIVIDHLEDEEVRALRLALNRIGEQGEWDFDELKLEISELLELDAPLEATGFAYPQIEALLLADDYHEAGPGPDTKGPTITKLGDVWRLGSHLVACADARDPTVYATLMKKDQARLILTDEPFNVPIQGNVTNSDHAEFVMASGEMSAQEFQAFNHDWMEASLQHLMPGGMLATFIDWRSVELVLAVGRSLGLDLLNLVIWAKTNAGQGALWRSQHEMLPVFRKPGGKHINNVQLSRHGRYRSNLWTYPGASSLSSDARQGLAHHPTVKPVALLEDALLDITNAGDRVIEPFCGSGSTLIACERTGRRCRAIELDPQYVDLTIRRWEATTGKLAFHHLDGTTFRDRAAEISAPDDVEVVHA